MLVAVEGIDGSGKTTLARILGNALRNLGYETELTQEPYLYRSQIEGAQHPATKYLLFLADRLEHTEKVLLPNFHARKITITDRYLLSTLVYQVKGEGMNPGIAEWASCQGAFVPPVVTFFLDIDPETALSRIIDRDGKMSEPEKSRLLAKLTNWRAEYQGLAMQDPEGIVRLDASRSLTDLRREAVTLLAQRFEKLPEAFRPTQKRGEYAGRG